MLRSDADAGEEDEGQRGALLPTRHPPPLPSADHADGPLRRDQHTGCCRSCGLFQLCRQGCYSVYVLHLMLFSNLVNQLDRYMLAVVTKPMAQDIHYGDIVCMKNESYPPEVFVNISCNGTDKHSCESIVSARGQSVCEWNYNGQGFDYQLLAGPIFIVIYTFGGLFLGLAADYSRRVRILACCVFFWSLMTCLTGLVQHYWQLALLRFGLGLGEAGLTPIAISLLSDVFEPQYEGLVLGVFNRAIYTGYSLAYIVGNFVYINQAGFSAQASSLLSDVFEGSVLATALGFFNWGIYLGFGMTFAAGSFIRTVDILGQGWRWCFYLSGMPGIVLATLILTTMREPERKTRRNGPSDAADPRELVVGMNWWQKVRVIVCHFMNPSLLLICLAGAIRNGAGYVWAYNVQVYYEGLGRSPEEIGAYLSWIPMVGGSTSVVLGGIIADRVVIHRGPNARLVVIAISLLLAAPFAAGALLLEPPGAYLMLIPTYVIGEVWVGVTLAVVIELVPTALRTTSVALYLFIISNIGGNAPLIVPGLQAAFEHMGATTINALRDCLLVLFPGQYVFSGILYLLTLVVIQRDLRHTRTAYMAVTGASPTVPSVEEQQAFLPPEKVPDKES